MAIQDWVDTETIKIITRHTSGSFVALLFFGAMDYVIEKSIMDSTVKDYLHIIDHFALVGLFAWLVYQMVCLCWNNRVKFGAGPRLIVA